MRAIERVKAHHAGREGAVVEVTEWGEENGEALKIYVAPLTVKQQQMISQAGEKDGDVGTALSILINLAKDEAGDALFSVADKPQLLRAADPLVVARVAGEIYAAATTSSPFTV